MELPVLPTLPPYRYSDGRYNEEDMRSYAEEAVKQEREACVAICVALQDRAEEAKALAKFRAAEGKSVSDELSRGKHWSTVALYNSALNIASVAIRARSEQGKEQG